MASRGMGRGLAAILPDASEADGDLRRVPVATIRPNARQPRTRFDPESISALAASIAETGVIQPLVVCPLADGRYELIAGERRWRAAQEAGLETVPAVIRTEGEVERLQTALIENVAREDLNAVDAARACATLIEDLGVTKEELARRLGRSRPSVSNLIRILDLPDEALELIAAGELSEGHGRALLQVRGNDERRRLAREAAKRGWSVRETERRAKLAEGPRRAKVVSHPDTEAALAQAEEELERALGAPVRVRPARRGIRAELHFDDVDALLEFARGAKPG
jgi:ParB family transcriptional regulator, chromosome partitioning protein